MKDMKRMDDCVQTLMVMIMITTVVILIVTLITVVVITRTTKATTTTITTTSISTSTMKSTITPIFNPRHGLLNRLHTVSRVMCAGRTEGADEGSGVPPCVAATP